MLLFSTRETSVQPLEAHSKLMLPVPEKRSSTLIDLKSKLFARILKRPVFAKSVVGRALNLAGR